MKRDAGAKGREPLTVAESAEYLLQECRMVLPGIQALLGFQLVAVFNARFAEALSAHQQRLHLLSMLLVVVGIAVIMTPAAYHRQTGGHEVTAEFVALSTRLLLWSMPPLALAICIDVYVIARMILPGVAGPGVAAGALFAVFAVLWFALPRLRPRHSPRPEA